jgi:thiol-disulfide isomerase/thioredoxin
MTGYSKTCNVRQTARLMTDRRLLAAALLLLLCAPFGLLQAELPSAEPGYQLNRLETPVAAPDFSLNDIDGEQHSLRDYHGKVIMLNFWATWCPPCRREIPSMESIYQDMGDKGFVVLGVNQFETPDHVFAYMGQLSVFPTFPILFDPDSKISGLYGVKGLPTTLLINRQGQVVYRAAGGRDFDHPEVRAIVDKLLTEGNGDKQ